MSSFEIFFKEFHNAKRKHSIIKNVVIIGVLTVVFSQNEVAYDISRTSVVVAVILLAFISSITTVFNFNRVDKVKNYVSLTNDKVHYNLSLFISVIILTFLDKVMFFAAVAIILSGLDYYVVAASLITTVLCVMVSFMLLAAHNKNSITLYITSFIMLASMISLCFISVDFILVLATFLLLSLVGMLILVRLSSNTFIYVPKTSKKVAFKNYYFNVLVGNKVLLVNTIVLLGFAVVYMMYLFEVASPYILAIPTAILGSNKIISCLVSSEKDTLKKLDSFPGKELYKDYFILNICIMYLIYFIYATSLIFMFEVRIMVAVAVLVLCPLVIAIVNTYAECKMPIKEWSDLNQLWKSPRNYMATVAVAILAVAIIFIEQMII